MCSQNRLLDLHPEIQHKPNQKQTKPKTETMKLLNRNNSVKLTFSNFTTKSNKQTSDDASITSSSTRQSRSIMKDDISVSSHSCSSFASSSSLSPKTSTRKTSSNKNQRRRVSFASKASLHEISFLDDLELIEQQWYSSSDYYCFKARDLNIIKAMNESSESENNDSLEATLGDSTRGLEKDRAEQKRRVAQHRREAYAIVRSQQEVMAGPQSIARAYGRVARSASRDALILGRLDALHASTA
jgi:murein L,D-transpeptidase YcbB/YkuD